MAKYKRKMRKEEEAIPTKNLPEDLIMNILIRLSIKSLLRFRCVSKLWYGLITDPAFIKMQLNQSLETNSNHSLLFTTSSSLYSLDLDSYEQQATVVLNHPSKSFWKGTRILGSCNGLLCIYNSERDIYLWNPSTRKHQKLPYSPTQFPFIMCYICSVVYGFGYDPTFDDYKLIRIVQCTIGNDPSLHSEVKVYTLSTNSWRTIGNLPCPIERKFGVFANSALHWVPRQERVYEWNGLASTFILSFDLKEEEFREVLLPDFLDDKCKMDVGVLEGQLCLFCNFCSVCFEVWVMKDYGVRDSWVKQFSMKCSPSAEFRPLCYSKNGEVILQKRLFEQVAHQELVMYDPQTGGARNLMIRGVTGKFETDIYVGSLNPLNPRRKRKNKRVTDGKVVSKK